MASLENSPKNYGSIIEEISSGQVKIPQFQRQFVWDIKASAKLVDSIIKGYPIGTFIFWRTDEQLRAVRNIGFGFVAGLGLMAMFLISNTIRVTILARRREIGIMKLVGATNRFIRGPFFVEGALIGLIGSAITVGLLFLGYSHITSLFEGDVSLAFRLVPIKDVALELGGLIVGLGLLIGIWGSTMSIRKFLKV